MNFFNRAYEKLLPHPARFYGDMQRSAKVINLHKKICTFLQDLTPGALILDVGSGNRRLPLKDKTVLNVDYIAFEKTDIVGNALQLPFKEAMFDAVIVQQVLEHVENPLQILREAARVLKDGGKIWVETPFMYPVHDNEDYWRWTKKGLELMCSRIFEREDSGVVMGGGSAMSLVTRYSSAVMFSFGSRLLFNFFLLLSGILTFWLKYLDFFIRENPFVAYIAPAIFFSGKKRKRRFKADTP